MESLAFLDAMLASSGNRLNQKIMGYKYGGIILNWVVRFMIIVFTIYRILFLLMIPTLSVMFKLQVTAYYTASLIIVILCANRRSRVMVFLDDLMTDGDSKHIRRTSIWSFILVLSVFGYAFIMGLIREVYFDDGDVQHKVRAFFTPIPVIMNDFTIIYPLYYVIVFQILSRHQVESLKGMRQDLKANTLNLIKQMNVLKQLANVRSEFEQLFNIIPFIVFGVLFITIQAEIHIIKYNSSGTVAYVTFTSVTYLIETTIEIAVTFFLVLRVCKAKEKINQLITDMIDIMQQRSVTQSYMNGCQLMIDSLKSYQDFHFTGWKLFSIDRYLILAFISSIISYSVLWIQLDTN